MSLYFLVELNPVKCGGQILNDVSNFWVWIIVWSISTVNWRPLHFKGNGEDPNPNFTSKEVTNGLTNYPLARFRIKKRHILKQPLEVHHVSVTLLSSFFCCENSRHRTKVGDSKAWMNLFDIILTQVHHSLSPTYSFDSLIRNSDGFLSINDLCNFSGLALFILS